MSGIGKKAYRRNSEFPSIGFFIKEEMRKQKITNSALARQMGISASCVFQYQRSRSLQYGIIWNLSKALQLNIFALLAKAVNVPFVSEAETATRAENEALKTQVFELNEQVKELQFRLEEARRR